MSDTTRDALLGGRVMLTQPAKGFRAGPDAVFLAASVSAKPGDRVLDAGCGAGAAGLCLAARAPGVEVEGVEVQAEYADLAEANGLSPIWREDLFAPSAAFRNQSYDWVLTNPPYFDPAATAAPDAGRDLARRAARPLGDWITSCLKRLKSGGGFALVHEMSALPEALSALVGVGDVAVLPLQSREGRAAKRMILKGRKGARGPFRLAPPLILHDGAAHERDEDDYSSAARRVLRDGAALEF